MTLVSRMLVRTALAVSIVLSAAAIATPAQSRDLVALMEQDLGGQRPQGCPNKWCACYMDQVLAKAGYSPLGSFRARDFAKYGKAAEPMSPGSIMVMRNHVGVVAGTCPDGRVLLISGNYSRKVAVGCYHPSKAIAWRKPVRT